MPVSPLLIEKDWLVIDGRLEPIDFAGHGDDRSPLELIERIVTTFSSEGDWVLDPFAGLGSTLLAAQALGRRAIGFERNADRADWVRPRLTPPNRIIHAPIETLADHDLPVFDLVCTSPPYPMVRLEDDPWGVTYFEDMRAIFAAVARATRPGGKVVVEVSNILTEDGFRPLVGQMASALGAVLVLEREIVRINSSDWMAGPGVGHSSLLVFGVSRSP